MKIIVTGSRHWEDLHHLYNTLITFSGVARIRSERLTIVHGHCPSGADAMTDRWADLAREWDASIEVVRYPADWYGPCHPDCYHRPRRPGGKCVAAGPRRNVKMIDENLDADHVLAFPLGEGRGTRGCMEYAESKGLRPINLGEK